MSTFIVDNKIISENEFFDEDKYMSEYYEPLLREGAEDKYVGIYKKLHHAWNKAHVKEETILRIGNIELCLMTDGTYHLIDISG